MQMQIDCKKFAKRTAKLENKEENLILCGTVRIDLMKLKMNTMNQD